MPQVSIPSTAGGYTLFTSKTATKEAPDNVIFRILEGETGQVAIISPQDGDTLYTHGVYFTDAEAPSFDLIAGQSITLVANTGFVKVVWHRTSFSGQ